MKGLDFLMLAPELMLRLRKRKGWSRGQMARQLKVTSTVVFNLETGRSRIKLEHFWNAMEVSGISPEKTIGNFLASIQTPALAGGALVRQFRNRLKMSQAALAKELGYASSSMVHHFEKGIREPSLRDFLRLMHLAGDDIQQLVLHLTEDRIFAARFPKGFAARRHDWVSYWSSFHHMAIRQIMRTDAYRKLSRIEAGYFATILGISLEEEHAALQVLEGCQIIRYNRNGKPVIDPSVQIVIPKNISKTTLDDLKLQWLEFTRRRFLEAPELNPLLSVDVVPCNREMFEDFVGRIRNLQDELHNQPQTRSDGFITVLWGANFLPIVASNVEDQ